MKAFSTWQPHASLLGAGLKPYETRSWPAHRNLIGKRVAIHAAKTDNDIRELAAYYVAWNEDETFYDESYHVFLKAIVGLGFKTLRDLPRGTIIGTAILDASIPTNTLIEPGPFGDFSPGRYAWRMRDPQLLPEPIPFVGKQGFFDVPDELIANAFRMQRAA
ncbi:hypothetical protein RHDC4_00057 [Rhodocyclaceae bacterium]|nr:hypothetical protein RHDC4_00057 [Rhodocyclaceae bacterium]